MLPPIVLRHFNKEQTSMTTKQTRRAVLAVAASVPALAILPAAALSSPAGDSIFAAIDRQKQLWAEWDYETHPEPSHGSPEYEAWEQWQHAAGDAYNNGLRAMLKMKPQTREGAAALIAYCLAEDSGMFGSDAPESEAVNERRLLRTIAKAIPDLA
jgi:hypothetical protein